MTCGFKPYAVRRQSFKTGCFSWAPVGTSPHGHASSEAAERSAEAHYRGVTAERDRQWRELLQRTADYVRIKAPKVADLLERLAKKGP